MAQLSAPNTSSEALRVLSVVVPADDRWSEIFDDTTCPTHAKSYKVLEMCWKAVRLILFSTFWPDPRPEKLSCAVLENFAKIATTL